MLSPLRHAFRSLSRTPGFSAVAVLTMAVAIGACTALFSVLQAVVLNPLPYPQPETLVSIWATNPERNFDVPAVSWAKYEAYRDRTDVFSALGVTAGNGFTLTGGTGEPEQVAGLHVSASFLDILGLPLAHGRNFTADEDREAGPPVVIISHALWQSRYGSDAGILGRSITVDGTPREVVGVLPARLPVPYNNTAVLIPRPYELPYLTPEQRPLAIAHSAIGRLAPGVTLEQAQLRIAEMAAQFKAANPAHIDAQNQNEVRTLTQQVLGNLTRQFWTLAGAVGLVLLIACLNIANLFLARVSSRQKEIAVRLSVGARRGEIIRQFLAESLAFSLIAGVLGVLLAWWSLQGIVALAGPQLPRADEIALDPAVLLFALAAALVASLLIGIYPALQGARTDVGTVLKDNTRGAGGGRAARAFRGFLVVAQVALSLTLLIGAGLLVLSFGRIQRAEPGFAAEGRAYGVVNLPTSRYQTPEQTRNFYRQLDERLQEAPELAGGAAITGLPLTGAGFFSPYAVRGRPLLPVQERPLANVRTVTPGYFSTLGIGLRSGRFFAPTDRFGSELVAIINESFARKLFAGGPAVDEYFLTGPTGDVPVRIVGVIQDVKSAGLAAAVPDEIYYPRDHRGGAFMAVVGRARPGLAASAVIPVLRRVLAEIDPQVALATPQTMEDLVVQSLGVQRLTMSLLLAFAGIAALLAAVGIYSVMAYNVTQRTGEIGVRIALGATTGNILRLIFRAGAGQVGLGLGLGLVGAYFTSRLLAQSLFEVKPFDPLVFGAVAAFFAAVAALACVIPARRASRVDPMTALRSE